MTVQDVTALPPPLLSHTHTQPPLHRRVQAATHLVQHLLPQQQQQQQQLHTPPAAAAAAAAAGSVSVRPPFPVLVHYVKTLLDGLQGLLLKPPAGTTAAGRQALRQQQQQQQQQQPSLLPC